MTAWNELVNELAAINTELEKAAWLNERLLDALGGISGKRQDRNVIFYASAFLQKAQAPPF